VRRDEIASGYRALLTSEEEKAAFDQMLGLCRLVFPFVEDRLAVRGHAAVAGLPVLPGEHIQPAGSPPGPADAPYSASDMSDLSSLKIGFPVLVKAAAGGRWPSPSTPASAPPRRMTTCRRSAARTCTYPASTNFSPWCPDFSSGNYFPREYSWSTLSVVSVPLTLLGLLERGPSHGYDLKRDYDAYFGRGKPLRYSQVYATLSRLARDGKAAAGPVEQGAGPERRRYVITEAGIADVERWLAEPAPPEPDLHSELFAKVVLALMLGRPADSYLDIQRAAHLQRMRDLTQLKRDGDPLDVILADHIIYRLEADLRWIDHTAARLDLLTRAVLP
jgi:DNA-binding PadR family transcriptional regulator